MSLPIVIEHLSLWSSSWGQLYLAPCAAVWGKRKRLFLFRRRLPWIIKNVHYRKRILTPWFIAGMGIPGYGDLCLWRKFQRDSSCVPMKGCHVVMGAFFSFYMRS